MCFSESNVTSIVRSKKLMLCTIVCVLAGTAIYILFRKDVYFVKFMGIDSWKNIELPPSFITQFVLYNLSDLLWALALMLFLCMQTSHLVKICGLIVPILMECAQLSDVCPGTFDMIDLLIYLLMSISFYIKWKLKEEL